MKLSFVKLLKMVIYYGFIGGETMENGNERLCYTIDELYKLKVLPLGKNSIYNLCKTKGFPSVVIGHRIFIVKAGLEKWLESKSLTAN